jgi:hypothetical protein
MERRTSACEAYVVTEETLQDSLDYVLPEIGKQCCSKVYEASLGMNPKKKQEPGLSE